MRSEGFINSIHMEWDTVIKQNSYTKRYDQGWNTELYNYFKDFKIKRISYTDKIDLPLPQKRKLKKIK